MALIQRLLQFVYLSYLWETQLMFLQSVVRELKREADETIKANESRSQ